MKTTRRKNSAVNAARWISYAAAGAVTAMGAANEADAAILFSGTLNTPMPLTGGAQHLLLKTLVANSNPGVHTFARFTHQSLSVLAGPSGGGSRHTYSLRFRPQNVAGNDLAGKALGTQHSGAFYASKLASGANISGGHFNTSNRFNFMGKWGGTHQATYFGNRKWTAAGTGFVAFEFNSGAGEQYGWAKVTVNGKKAYGMTLIDYAYGTPGQAIVVGQTAVPEPASLCLLALGAAGLLAMRAGRRRMSHAATNDAQVTA